MNALQSISRMNNLHTVFPAPSNTNSTANTTSKLQSTNSGNNGVSSLNSLGTSNYTSQSKNSNYTTHESTTTTTQNPSATAYTGMYSTGSKSPTNATSNKEPSKYAQYIPREIPLRSNNLNPTSKLESTNQIYTSDPKKKEINITTNNPELNFMMKNKFTPTNNTGVTSGGLSGVGTSGKTYIPTTQFKKPNEGYPISTKIA